MNRHSVFLAWFAAMTVALYAIAGSDAAGRNADSLGQRPQEKSSQARLERPRRVPSALLYSTRRAQLPAAHQTHAEKTRLGCIDCHANAQVSGSASDWLGPSPERCTECHGQKFAGVVLGSTPSSRIRVSHAKHAAKGIGCASCHGRVAERADAVGFEQLPLMATCLGCHSGPKAARLRAGSDCRLCHIGRGGVIQSRFREGLLLPSSSLGPVEHTGNWLYGHGEAAINQGPLCLGCHKEPECVACHNSPLRPRSIHPSDWLRLHGIEARQQGPACSTCHRSQSECLTCHLRAGLSPAGPRAANQNRGRFHPPPSIWTDRPRTGQHHAVQARLHMDECVSCHQERDCAACHATAAVGGAGIGAPFGRGISPHPPGFRTQCTGIIRKNPRACFVCHRTDDWELAPCR
jgi:hypothetical protein